MRKDRKIKLGLSMRYLGYHVAAWRHPAVPADGAVHFDYFLQSAIKAEVARLDMIFFADGLGIRVGRPGRVALPGHAQRWTGAPDTARGPWCLYETHWAGRELAAKDADVIYRNALELTPAKAFYDDVKARLAKHGRTADQLLIMPGVTLYVGRTRGEAQEKLDELQALFDPLSGLAMLHSYLGDLSAYDVDGPVSEVAVSSNQVRSIAENLLHLARKDKLSIRQLYQILAAGNGCRVLIGLKQCYRSMKFF